MTLRFHTLDVFSTEPFGGNPLAVVLGGDALSGAQMQRIAREFQLSETVFVLAATTATAMARLRIFTPFEELPFAGHPIVGAACALAILGFVPQGNALSFEFEAGIGPVAVHVRNTQGLPYAELTTAQLPDFSGQAPADVVIAGALGLDPEQLNHGAERARVASCGLPTLLVPLQSCEAMAGIEIDAPRLAALLPAAGARNVYAYARDYDGGLRARMFMPGIGEDPATGSAAAALAGRLASESDAADGRLEWIVRQGLEMGRPSELFISADRSAGQVTAVRVGGHAVRLMEGVLHVG
jgi:trans-2,3-dihydro-3-hydroxyanthranilate isomerase